MLLLLLLVLLLVSVVVVCGMVVQWCGDCIDCVVMGLNIIIIYYDVHVVSEDDAADAE